MSLSCCVALARTRGRLGLGPLLSAVLLSGAACTASTTGVGDDEGEDSTADENADESSSDSDCAVGQVGCMCTEGGGCDPGLECVEGLCESVGGESSSDDETDSGSEDGSCSGLGCACDGSPESCDAGLACVGGMCVSDSCGNGALDANEQCDDGNEIIGDGCDPDCTYTEVEELSLGAHHTCALIEGGRLRCWGEGFFGQLGYGNMANLGDTETPASVGDLALPLAITDVAAGGYHTCGRFVDESIRCWGQNFHGQLGYGDTEHRGDDEVLTMLPAVDLGGAGDMLAAGLSHTCVRAGGNTLRCWGLNTYGQLGISSLDAIGDNELPSAAQYTFLGTEAAALGLGGYHSCATGADNEVRCWGRADRGQSGYGSLTIYGDNEAPADAGPVPAYPEAIPEGVIINAVALGTEHTCGLFSSGQVLCWGKNDRGQLGQASTSYGYGYIDGEVPANLVPIELGATATALAAGGEHTCALLSTGQVRCWGSNFNGQLGQGNMVDVGDDEVPAAGMPVDLGAPAIMIAAGEAHSCAVTENFEVLCWGANPDGRLGYGHTNQIGDDETPASIGPIELL